jgi:chromosome segregation ATPase
VTSGLLEFAAELEHRDAELAQALEDVERLQHDVDELRARATTTAERLEMLPGAIAEAEADERATLDELEQARSAVAEREAALERARREDERLTARRDLQYALNVLRTADERAAIARLSRERLVGEYEEARRGVETLTSRATELGTRVRGVPYVGGGLEDALDWSSRARGELLLDHSRLVAQRETLVREASELLGSVLGEPLTSTAVTGVRERLARALHDKST